MTNPARTQGDYAGIIGDVMQAITKAELKHNPINSALEGWAVIREEADELQSALKTLRGRIEGPMWRAVKADNYDEVMSEARHVAAMALRFLKDVAVCSGTTWRGGEQGAMSENRQGAMPGGSSGGGAPFNAGSDLKMHVHIDGRKVAEAAMAAFETTPEQQIAALRATIKEQDRTIEEAKRANDMMREERDAAQACVRREREQSREVIGKYATEIERIAKSRDDSDRALKAERQRMEAIHGLASGRVEAAFEIPMPIDFSSVGVSFIPLGKSELPKALADELKRRGINIR